MTTATLNETIGSYLLTRRLSPCRLAARWLALHNSAQTGHIVYIFEPRHGRGDERRFVEAVERLGRLDHPHLQSIEQFSFGESTRPIVVAPFAGDVEGLLTLEDLRRSKGGQMSADETGRALTQLLAAFGYAQKAGVHHGPIHIDETMVDRRGSISIELFGFDRALRGLAPANAELVRDEVRAVVEIGYQLITGLRPEEPIIPAGRIVRKLSRQWDQWLEYGLDPTAGFESASQALALLPVDAALVDAASMIQVKRQTTRLIPTG